MKKTDMIEEVKLELKRTGFHNIWGVFAIPVAVMLQKGILSVVFLDFFVYVVMGIIVLIVDVMRPFLFCSNQKWGWLDNKYLNFLTTIEQWFVKIEVLREDERTRYSGMGTYLIGIIIVYGFFDFYIAAMSVMILAFGDPLARIIGKKYGTPRKWLISALSIAILIFGDFLVKIVKKATGKSIKLPEPLLKGKSVEGVSAFMVGSFIIMVLAVSLLDSLAIPFFPIGYTMGTKVWMIFAGCAVGAVVEVYAGNLDNFFIPVLSAVAMNFLV